MTEHNNNMVVVIHIKVDQKDKIGRMMTGRKTDDKESRG